ncbi:MAG: hypothetical protein NVSMB65_18980 [Chloroflexota bacterium]
MAQGAKDFTLGVNYWPRRKAMYWWKDFDRAEVESEFAEIAALKLHVVRIFLLWEDFQPAAETISDRALADLGTVLDVAIETGVKVMPTFFTGHMSGINFWPAWALSDEDDPTGMLRIAAGEYTTRRGRDPYADPFMLDAEVRLVGAVCERFGAHPAVYSWNFSNEPDLFYTPRTYADGARWNELLARAVRRYSALPVSAGMHLPTIAAYNGFRPDALAPHDDFLSMHAYSIYYPPTELDDPLNSDVVPLACLVTEALGGKRVLFEEFGYASSEKGDVSEHRTVRRGPVEKRQYFADDASGGRYYREVLDKLVRCGALGAFGWMFSDYDPSLWSRPPYDSHDHERFFGLTRYDGSVKPSGEALRALAARAAAGDLPPRSVGPLHLDPAAWYQDPTGNFDRLFQEWRGRI